MPNPAVRENEVQTAPVFFEADDAGTEAEFDLADERHQETAPAAKPKAEAPKHDARMLRIAAQFGIDAERASRYSPEQLEVAVETAAEQTARRESILADALRARPQAPAAVAQPQEDEFDWGEVEVEDDFGRMTTRKATEKDYGPSAKFLKSQQKTIKDLEKRLAERDQRDAQAETMSYRESADEAFTGLGDGFAAIFGSGEIAPDSDEFFARSAVWDQAAKAANAAGQKPSPKAWKALVEKTARRMYGKVAVKPAPAGDDSPEAGGYGGPVNRLAGVNGNGAPKPPANPRSEAAKARRDPVTGLFRSAEEMEHEREERERQAYFSGGVSERSTNRRSPAEATGRNAAIAYLNEERESFGGDSPDSPDEYDASGNFVP